MANTAPILPDTRFDTRSKLSPEPVKEDGGGEDFTAAIEAPEEGSSVPLADAGSSANSAIRVAAAPDCDATMDADFTEISEDVEANTLEAIIDGWNGVSGALSQPKSKVIAAIAELPASGLPRAMATLLPDEPVEAGAVTAQINVHVPEPQTPLSDANFISGIHPEMMMLNADQTVDIGGVIDGTGLVKGADQAAARGEVLPNIPRLAAEHQPTILRQVADAAITIRDEQVEIALSPEELGRIRMVLSGREHAPHLVVWAERPEVLDQLRRNATMLLENFGETGLQDATFEFREGGFEGRDAQQDWTAGSASAVELEIPAHLAQQAIASGGWTALGAHIDVRM